MGQRQENEIPIWEKIDKSRDEFKDGGIQLKEPDLKDELIPFLLG